MVKLNYVKKYELAQKSMFNFASLVMTSFATLLNELFQSSPCLGG